MATKPVVVQLKDGAQYGVRSAAEAARVYPDGKVIGHQDGTAYEAPKKAEPAKKADAREEAK